MKNKIIVTEANMSKLTEDAFMDCLFKEGEDTTNHVEVEGIVNTFYFHPKRLEEKRELVIALIDNLPVEFKTGWSFLRFCMTKDGGQWTGMHNICEQLAVMAIGLDLMAYLFPRRIWPNLPGEVPFLIIK